ncbi:MAG: FkbM family methyltransferase [Phycisphaerales bacterium]
MIDDLVYDVGMNDGRDTAYYLARGYRVVAIEADPTYAEEVGGRFAEHVRSGRLVIVNAAVGRQGGRTEFFICEENRAWNTFDRASLQRPGVKFRPIEVPVRPFEDILAEHGVPMFLKVDIEGSDHLCLEAIDPRERPRFLSWEIARLDELFLMRDKGYNAFQLISQSTLRPLELGAARGRAPGAATREARTRVKTMLASIPGIRRAVRRARAAVRKPGASDRAESPVIRRVEFPGGTWEFRFGSAGPFGPDQDQRWLTAEEVAYAYLDMWLHSGPKPGEINDWFDVHATTLPEGEAPPALWPPRGA